MRNAQDPAGNVTQGRLRVSGVDMGTVASSVREQREASCGSGLRGECGCRERKRKRRPDVAPSDQLEEALQVSWFSSPTRRRSQRQYHARRSDHPTLG